MTSTTEQTETAQAATAAEAKPAQKAPAGARARHVAPSKAKPGKQASPAKKAHKTAPGATSKPRAARAGKPAKKKGVREGSKTETVLDLLKRPGGATAKELLKATGWQAHSLRGFISGMLGKKMGLAVNSTKGEGGQRSYSIKA